MYTMAEAYGEEGRRAYIKARFTFDVAWPIVYTMFLATGVSWLSTQAFNAKSRWQRVNLLPVCGALFDYLENISASLVMFCYPQQTAGVDLLATFATPVKWMLISLSFVLLVVLVVKVLWGRFRQGNP